MSDEKKTESTPPQQVATDVAPVVTKAPAEFTGSQHSQFGSLVQVVPISSLLGLGAFFYSSHGFSGGPCY